MAFALGLGLRAGAVAHAQADTTRAAGDALRAAVSDNAAARDTAPPPDTVAAPFARAELPPSRDIGEAYRWDRHTIFSSGAVSMADLLDRLPGTMAVRTGWLMDAQAAAYAGGFGRVRQFVDGIELDPLDPAAGGVDDLGQPQLWMYEDLATERAGDEVRVHLRSWRNRLIAPETRVDVLTGDRDGNVFRGYYGKRFGNGFGIQAAFTNTSTREQRNRAAGDGTLQGYVLRTGWARGRLSVDAFAQQVGVDRRPAARLFALPERPAENPVRTLAYLRAGLGDPETAGWWVQGTAASHTLRDDTRPLADPDPTDDVPADTGLRVAQVQWVTAAGWNVGALRASLTSRIRAGDGRTRVAPMLRLSYDAGWLGASLVGERPAGDSLTRVDAGVRVVPFGRVALAGTVSHVRGDSGRTQHWRAEAGVRLRGALWMSGGVLRRDAVGVAAPLLFDARYVPVLAGVAQGVFASVRGALWKDLKADVTVTQWDGAASAFYLPRVQARSELFIESDWRSRFPQGHFGFKGSLIHEYRDPVRFPVASGATQGVQVTNAMRGLSTLLEIRILDATLTWQFRNLVRLEYQQAPGYLLPRGVNIYGVRWNFRG